nr:MAG TPA: hypothetical protein [Caudoviricetes sp.]
MFTLPVFSCRMYLVYRAFSFMFLSTPLDYAPRLIRHFQNAFILAFSLQFDNYMLYSI